MIISNLALIYFSPTGSTKLVTTKLGEMLSTHFKCSITEFDLTDYNSTAPALAFGEDTLLVVGFPVYSGRVPKTMLERIEKINGTNTPVVMIAAYGHRHYDDSLLEMKTVFEERGFIAVGASAIVTKHNIVTTIGVGRPNYTDLNALSQLASSVYSKLATVDTIDLLQSLFVKGNNPYREYMATPIKPHATSKCNACGLCAKKCPTNAISLDDPKITDNQKCITCMRCINICPFSARKFHPIERIMAKKSIKKNCDGERITENFI